MFSQEHRNDWVFQVCLSHYTIQGACVAIDNVDDQSEITATWEAMKLLGFHDDKPGGMFQVLSAMICSNLHCFINMKSTKHRRRNQGGTGGTCPPNFFGQHTRIYYTSITAMCCSRLVPPQNLTASYATAKVQTLGAYCMSCSSPAYYANARARKLATPRVVAVTRGAVSSRPNTG